jgi:hypothetical protein
MRYDWLGICLEMMAEYYPVDIHKKADTEKYWSISEHTMRLMEYSGISRRSTNDEKLDRRNDLVKDMIRIFTAMSLIETTDGDTEINSDNVALNNLLLLSIISG